MIEVGCLERERMQREIRPDLRIDPSVKEPWRNLAALAGAALLESGPGYGDLGRYGLYAAFPRATFEVRGSQWKLAGDLPLAAPSLATSPMEVLRSLLSQTALKNPIDGTGPIFQGGWIGYLGYDLGTQFEQVGRRHPSHSTLPDVSLSYYDTFLVHDRLRGTLELTATDRFEEGSHARAQRLDRLQAALQQRLQADTGGALIEGALASDCSPDDYCSAVARVLEYLSAGDVFQVNISQEISATLTGSVPHLYGRAMRQSPAPFACCLRGADWSVVSTSPERFLLLTPDRRVETRPIKGTRPRGRDPIHDLLLRDELTLSPKDEAELTMIVDLERNDLGRVCEFGSVQVRAHRAIESFSNVHHAVSVVEGRLKSDRDIVDLLAATFPGGSITGAPKIRAMEIIDELEQSRRGVYTGAIGYISDHGRMDLNIAIRTLVIERDRVSYRVGGGIVIDSDPLAEYRETLAKGRRLRAILLGEDY